jgi:hypothetical protein
LAANFSACDINSEIVHPETIRSQHGSHENLANLVDIALGRPEHDNTRHGTFGAEFAQFRVEHGHGGAHCLRRGHHVGKKHLPPGELLAHIVHSGNVAVVNGVAGRHAVR